MDANNAENLSTNLENVSQELLDIESNMFFEDDSSLSQMQIDQEELQQSQTLEEEFADYTQQAAISSFSSFDELDTNTMLETDTDIDSEFSVFQSAQLPETTDADPSQFDLELEDLGLEPHKAEDLELPCDANAELEGLLEESVASSNELIADLEGFSGPQTPELELLAELENQPEIENSDNIQPSQIDNVQPSETTEVIETDVTEPEERLELCATPELEMQTGLSDESHTAIWAEEETAELEPAFDLEVASGEETSETDQQVDQLLQLEATIEQNQAQIQALQSLVDRKIDPEIHTHLLQDLKQYKERIANLEDSLNSLQVGPEESSAPQPAAAEYDALQQVADEQKQTIADLQETIARLENDVKDWQAQANAKIDPAEFAALQTQSNQQGELITKLESEIEALKVSYEQSQIASDQKVELELYESLQADVQQLTLQIQDWEQRYDQLSQQLDQQTQLANERIAPDIHATLEQKVQAFSEQVQTLESEKAALEQSVQNWQHQAEAKIDRVEYDAVLEQLQCLKQKNARSLWTRMMDWIKGC